MATVVLLDAGPLVALMDHREQHHAWAKDAFATLSLPLITCQAVLTETLYLLRTNTSAREKLLRHLQAGHLVDGLDFRKLGPRIAALMLRYSNVPMSFADACLVAMAADSGGGARILTLDSDFLIYRREDGTALSLTAPYSP